MGYGYVEDRAYYPDDVVTFASGARVRIISGAGQDIPLSELESGLYVDTAGALHVMPGETYDLEIDMPTGEHIRSRTVVPLQQTLIQGLDTLRVVEQLDSVQENGWWYVRSSLMSDPVTFAWEPTGVAYSFLIGSDETHSYNWETGDSTNVIHHGRMNTFVKSTKSLTAPAITIFDNPPAHHGSNWSLLYSLYEPGHVTYRTDINVYAYDQSLALYRDASKSQLENAYGVFGSLSQSKRTIIVDMICR